LIPALAHHWSISINHHWSVCIVHQNLWYINDLSNFVRRLLIILCFRQEVFWSLGLCITGEANISCCLVTFNELLNLTYVVHRFIEILEAKFFFYWFSFWYYWFVEFFVFRFTEFNIISRFVALTLILTLFSMIWFIAFRCFKLT
jgi:hypothetical protein